MLAEFFQDFVERSNHTLAASWSGYGDRCSRLFFDFHKVGKKKVLIKELVDG
jgi:hypothetical protein